MPPSTVLTNALGCPNTSPASASAVMRAPMCPTTPPSLAPMGRVDDVHKHDGGEHAVGLRPAANPGQELLDLVKDRIGDVTAREMILARQLNVPGAGNAAGEEATGADVYGPRPAAHSPRARRGRYLNGSFTTTLTPEMTPVAALRTCSTASWLISPAPLRAPVAAADAASSAPRPTCLAPAMAPSTAFRATSPTSPPTSAVLLTRTRALVLTVSTASTPTSFVPLRTPMTPPLAVAPRSPPTWAVPLMAPRRMSEIVEVSAVPTAPVPLMVVTSVPLTVSTTLFRISPVPLIEPTSLSFTDSMIPLCVVVIWTSSGAECLVGAVLLVESGTNGAL